MTQIQKILEHILDKFRDDGFDLIIRDDRSGVTISIVVPQYPYHQVSRFFPFNCRPSEAALIYWDLSNSIRRKERYASKRMA